MYIQSSYTFLNLHLALNVCYYTHTCSGGFENVIYNFGKEIQMNVRIKKYIQYIMQKQIKTYYNQKYTKLLAK